MKLKASGVNKAHIASDQAALDDFLKYFPYEEWDYDDI